jgi:hypothetical protein
MPRADYDGDGDTDMPGSPYPYNPDTTPIDRYSHVRADYDGDGDQDMPNSQYPYNPEPHYDRNITRADYDGDGDTDMPNSPYPTNSQDGYVKHPRADYDHDGDVDQMDVNVSYSMSDYADVWNPDGMGGIFSGDGFDADIYADIS